MTLYLYVEGGGDSKEQHARCREGFRKLMEQSGLRGHMPRIVAGGSRSATYRQFTKAQLDSEKISILLVDSEEPITQSPWAHVLRRDQWERPSGATDDQLQFMATCMETWIIADRQALSRFFGANLNEKALLPLNDLEQRRRDEVQETLEQATRPCGPDRQYKKGRRSFQVLASLDPQTLTRYLPHFRRLIDTLNSLPNFP